MNPLRALASALPLLLAACAATPLPSGAAARDAQLICGGHFAELYGVSLEEGCRRMRSQDHVLALVSELHQGGWPDFSALWLQHEPTYAIVVTFEGGASEAVRAAVLARAHPSIRGDIAFRSARRTAAEIGRDQDRIVAALQGLQGGWSGGHEVQTDRFVFIFGTESLLEEARRRIPADLAGDVDLRVGPVPVLFAT